MCALSYTVGPQEYHVIFFDLGPPLGTKTSFLSVKLLYIRRLVLASAVSLPSGGIHPR